MASSVEKKSSFSERRTRSSRDMTSKSDSTKNTSVLKRIHSLNPSADSKLPRNDKGGILVRDAELETAFKFLDVSNRGYVTINDLKKRLSPFYKEMPLAEYEFLMGGQKKLTIDDLHALLDGNEITGFDPVEEAFKVYDPDCTGFVNIEVIKKIFQNLGFDDLSDDDIETIIEAADMDRDGKISLEDFRRMLDPTHADTLEEVDESSDSSSDSSYTIEVEKVE